MIEEYTFGKIVINGKAYNSDLIIFDDTVRDNWWRKKGHELCVVDIEQAIDKFNPTVVVVGTGKLGIMKVLPETETFLQSRQIRLIVQKTEQACKTYNKLLDSEKVLGACHLTC
ncbi:MAG: Mth938-like domain-containing protein [bacterium]|nr:MAG: Mth938-like domain-containing protein [bacterium]